MLIEPAECPLPHEGGQDLHGRTREKPPASTSPLYRTWKPARLSIQSGTGVAVLCYYLEGPSDGVEPSRRLMRINQG